MRKNNFYLRKELLVLLSPFSVGDALTVLPRGIHGPCKKVNMPVILVFFLASGWSALVYQVVWQRVLFRVYGVDIHATTYVVTAFMLGLGVGSLLGGALSRRFPMHAIFLFGAFELGIGLFGLLSVSLFEWVARFTAGTSDLFVAGLSFSLLLLPTLMMGATLPILTGYASVRSKNVGRSVSKLYLVNTLGAALGAWSAGHFLLSTLGLRGSSLVAAVVNLSLAIIVLLLWQRIPMLGKAQKAEAGSVGS